MCDDACNSNSQAVGTDDVKQESQSPNDNYNVRNETRTFKLDIFKADITNLAMDCIVNAANNILLHIGGVARAIALAAGPALKQECDNFIHSGNEVAVTDIFISTGGNLPAKCVMHAVGPRWHDYDANNKAQCGEDLRRTVIRCLVEADRQGFTSIAFPSISAAIFGVPKAVCARCYVDAVKHFSTFNKEQTSLCEIVFVDVDEDMVKAIKEHFEQNWTNPCDPHIVQRDCDFANTHFYSPTRGEAKYIAKLPDTNTLTLRSSASAKTFGASTSSVLGNRLPIRGTSGWRRESPMYQIGTSDWRRESPIYPIGTSDWRRENSTHPIGTSDWRRENPIYQIGTSDWRRENPIYQIGTSDWRRENPIYQIGTSDWRRESPVFQIGTFTLHTDSKPAFDHSSDITITVGEPFDKLSGICDFSVSSNNKIVSELKNTFKLLNVSTTKSLQQKQVCALLPEPDNAQAIQEAIGNLDVIMQNPNHNILAQKIRTVVLTSSILYKEPDNVQNINQHCFDINKVGDFARYLFEYLNNAYEIPSISITLVGCEDALQSIHHVMESLDRAKTISREDVGISTDPETTCALCDWIKPTYPVKCCGKCICQDCQQRMSNCPFCLSFWRILIGNQPPGTMKVCWINECTRGYEHTHAWNIEYSFPSGIQKVYHPNPGATYTGFFYRAYLPDNRDGIFVMKLLRLAFLRKLTFTIGRPLITERNHSISWNVIQHKTSLHGGGLAGYPDPNYLLNVTKELTNKGVTFDTLSAYEKCSIEDFEHQILTCGKFTDTHPE